MGGAQQIALEIFTNICSFADDELDELDDNSSSSSESIADSFMNSDDHPISKESLTLPSERNECDMGSPSYRVFFCPLGIKAQKMFISKLVRNSMDGDRSMNETDSIIFPMRCPFFRNQLAELDYIKWLSASSKDESGKFKFTTNNPKELTIQAVLLNTFCDITPLALVDKQYLSKLFPACDFKTVDTGFVLAQLSLRNEDDISIKPHLYRSFEVFVHLLLSIPDKERLIMGVESLVPHVGPALIWDGFTLLHQICDVDSETAIRIFKILAEHPNFPISIPGHVQSGEVNPDEWVRTMSATRNKFKPGGGLVKKMML